MVNFYGRTCHEENREADESHRSQQMCPNVASLCVNTEDGLEALYKVWQRRSVTLPEEVVILQELWQVSIANNFPVLELLPHVHGEQLGILRSVTARKPSRVQPTRIKPGDIRPVQFLLLISTILILIPDAELIPILILILMLNNTPM